MERLKPATELKLVSRGNAFHAFTTVKVHKDRPVDVQIIGLTDLVKI